MSDKARTKRRHTVTKRLQRMAAKNAAFRRAKRLGHA